MLVRALILLTLFFCSALVGKDIAILVRPDFQGEVSFAARMKVACQNLGWKAEVFHVKKFKNKAPTGYDFVVCLAPDKYKLSRSPNYQAIFDPVHFYFDERGFLSKDHISYQGYLLTYTPGIDGTEKANFTDAQKFPYMQWYPTVYHRPYRVVDPSYIFNIGCIWGDRFSDVKHKELAGLLDKAPYMRTYGMEIFRLRYPQSYQYFIPDNENLYDAAANAGISLILHSAEHLKYGLPSGRIFEAAAASTVIICDENAFVKKHFGDSVLYIDTSGDALSIFKQIHAHFEWITAHKEAALEKAKRAHKIFSEKFVLEEQLLALERFHDQVLATQPKHFVRVWLENIGSYEAI